MRREMGNPVIPVIRDMLTPPGNRGVEFSRVGLKDSKDVGIVAGSQVSRPVERKLACRWRFHR